MADPRCTTFEDAAAQFAGRSTSAQLLLDQWVLNQVPPVVHFVKSHKSEVLYALAPADIERVARASEHALGSVRRSVAESVRSIADWSTPWAFAHVLHAQLEAEGAVPAYQEFRRYCREDPQARQALWEPAQRTVESAALSHGREAALAAMRWRIGNYYYSFLREIHLLAVLRHMQLNLNFHPLADALFRVDAWLDDLVVSLYVGNARYKSSEGKGRKALAQQLLRDAAPPLRFVDLQLPTQQVFGRVHLVGPAAVAEAARKIEKGLRR